MLYLIFRFGLPYLNADIPILTNTDSLGLYLAAQANQFALLQCFIAFIGICIAIAAIWGYITIRDGAKDKAEETIRKEVPELFNKLLEKHGVENIQEMIHKANMETYKKNSDEALYNEFRRMDKDPMEMEREREPQ